MRTIIIKETDYYAVNNYKCITYDLPLYDKLHDAKIKKGEILRLLVQEKNLYCNILVEDIEYGDGTIWIKHLIEKS